MGEETKLETKEEDKSSEGMKEETINAEDGEEKKVQLADPKPPLPFVLFVDLHCMGCAKKIERSISKIRGVEAVVMDMTKNEVTIKGVVEPQAVCDRIMKKTKRTAKVLSPLPEAEGDSIPDIVASQVSGLTTVELNVNMHCEPCAAQLKKKILKMKGVRTAETELSSGKVTVTGTMSPNHLVEYVYRHTKKQAKIVPQPEPEHIEQEENKETKESEEQLDEEKKAQNESDQEDPSPKDVESPVTDVDCEAEVDDHVMNKNADEQQGLHHHRSTMMCYYQPLYVMERVPAPQMFSDENPNACCIV